MPADRRSRIRGIPLVRALHVLWGGLKYCRGFVRAFTLAPARRWLTGAGAVRAHRPDNILGNPCPNRTFRAGAWRTTPSPASSSRPTKGCPGPERGHGRAARGRHVRLHGAGAAADGVRSERRHPDVGHRHADLLSVRGRAGAELPGVSFAFIGGVIAVTGYAGGGASANIGVALGAIIACGLAYTLIGLIVWAVNARAGGGRAGSTR